MPDIPSDPQRQPSTGQAPQAPGFTNPYDTPPPFPQAGAFPPADQDRYPGSYGGYSAFSGQGAPWDAPAGQGRPSWASLTGPSSGGPLRPAGADDRTWAILAHLSGVIAWIVSAGWLNAIGPLIVWLLQKDRSRFVRNASAGAFNFTITMWILGVVGWILTLTVIGAIIGIPMIIVSALGSIVLGIVGAVKSANGESYSYPWQLKVLS